MQAKPLMHPDSSNFPKLYLIISLGSLNTSWKEVALEKRKRLTLRHYTGGLRKLHFRNYFPELTLRDK